MLVVGHQQLHTTRNIERSLQSDTIVRFFFPYLCLCRRCHVLPAKLGDWADAQRQTDGQTNTRWVIHSFLQTKLINYRRGEINEHSVVIANRTKTVEQLAQSS